MRLRNLAAYAIAVLMALPAAAQEQTGAIQGVVKDSQGGSVPGATVEATSTSGRTLTATTDASGTSSLCTTVARSAARARCDTPSPRRRT